MNDFVPVPQADEASGEPENLSTAAQQDIGKYSLYRLILKIFVRRRMNGRCQNKSIRLCFLRLFRVRCRPSGGQEESTLVGQRDNHPPGDLG